MKSITVKQLNDGKLVNLKEFKKYMYARITIPKGADELYELLSSDVRDRSYYFKADNHLTVFIFTKEDYNSNKRLVDSFSVGTDNYEDSVALNLFKHLKLVRSKNTMDYMSIVQSLTSKYKDDKAISKKLLLLQTWVGKNSIEAYIKTLNISQDDKDLLLNTLPEEVFYSSSIGNELIHKGFSGLIVKDKETEGILENSSKLLRSVMIGLTLLHNAGKINDSDGVEITPKLLANYYTNISDREVRTIKQHLISAGSVTLNIIHRRKDGTRVREDMQPFSVQYTKMGTKGRVWIVPSKFSEYLIKGSYTAYPSYIEQFLVKEFKINRDKYPMRSLYSTGMSGMIMYLATKISEKEVQLGVGQAYNTSSDIVIDLNNKVVRDDFFKYLGLAHTYKKYGWLGGSKSVDDRLRSLLELFFNSGLIDYKYDYRTKLLRILPLYVWFMYTNMKFTKAGGLTKRGKPNQIKNLKGGNK